MTSPTFEKLLDEVGDSGRHQHLLFWLYVVPINFLIPWVALGPIFMISTPDHWCQVPGQPQHLDLDLWKTLTVPRSNLSSSSGPFSSCQQYNITADTVLALLAANTGVDKQNHSTLAGNIKQTHGIVDCQSGWTFDQTDYTNTLTSQEEWVCGKLSLGSTWLSAGVAGNVIGTLLFNSLSDIIGRRIVLGLTILIYTVFGLLRLYVRSTLWLMFTMFLSATCFPPMLELTLIIVMEQVSHIWRSRITAASFVMWTFGSCFLTLLAWSTHDWQILGLTITLPFIPFLLSFWVLPESPRWLLSRDRIDQCADLLRQIARRNQKPVPDKLEETLTILAKVQNTERNYGAVQLFKYPTIRLRTVLLTACYTFNNFFYYGLLYNMTNVSGNEFINFFLISITELPSNFIGLFASQIIGRRWTHSGAIVLAALFALATAFVGEDTNVWVPIVLLILSKMFIAVSFLVVYIQCSEIYPTTHRACGTGFSSLISSIVGVAAPFISSVSQFGSWIPFVILFLVGVLGYLSSSFLPETLGENLPQSLIEADSFLTTEKYWSYKGHRLISGKVDITQTNATEMGIDNLAISNTESSVG